jgi:signal peptidase II
MKKWIKLVLLSVILLSIDISIKWYVHSNIPKMSWLYPLYPYGGIGVFKDIFGVGFSINYVQNPGAAWGFFSSYSDYLFYFRIIIILSLIIYLIYSKPSLKKAVGICLIVTGAVGNIIDHILYGFVVDMFYFTFGSYSFPVFNVADSLITIGIGWILLGSVFTSQETKEKP